MNSDLFTLKISLAHLVDILGQLLSEPEKLHPAHCINYSFSMKTSKELLAYIEQGQIHPNFDNELYAITRAISETPPDEFLYVAIGEAISRISALRKRVA